MRMVVMKVRRVEALSTGARVRSLVYAGDALGVDWLGREVSETTDVVIVSVDRYEDGYLVSYREVHVRYELAPAS
jgi:RecA-family ATPase